MSKLGFKIKNALKENRKNGSGPTTQNELAEKIGFSYTHLSAVITGRVKPSMGLLEAIAQELNTTISDLLKD